MMQKLVPGEELQIIAEAVGYRERAGVKLTWLILRNRHRRRTLSKRSDCVTMAPVGEQLTNTQQVLVEGRLGVFENRTH
ncbi:hypothetical protein JCM12214_32920 [Geobacillus vulcani]